MKVWKNGSLEVAEQFLHYKIYKTTNTLYFHTSSLPYFHTFLVASHAFKLVKCPLK
jgi:hypothetical protein